MSEIEEIKAEIRRIKERNKKVEIDKAWETSRFRIICIAVITYIIAAFFLYFIGNDNFLLNAIVPAIGYYLSTQSLPFIKQWWGSRFMK
ncbi:MAG: hypothetical protein WC845_02860 [Candidatus Staskawiczbacteria bacterium]|jgi:hypothetical protein